MTDLVALSDAFRRGDLAAVRALLGDPPDFPNCIVADALGETCLEYAIHTSPLEFIRTLIELGADPNYHSPAGFPALIAALSGPRPERCEILELLLEAGADLNQRGINDYTPLHQAAASNDVAAIEVLMMRGADAAARTRIDDHCTPLEEAELLGHADAAAALRRLGAGGNGDTR